MNREIFYTDTVEKMINADTLDDESFSTRIDFLVSAAVTILGQSCPLLTVDEWCALADVLNGHYVLCETAIEDRLHSAWVSVYHSGPECDDKWSINCEAFAKRLEKMPLPEQLAAYEVVRNFWNTKEGHVENTYAKIFSKLGAPGLL